ncbi:MAG: hypothetical protein HC907_17600 [Richelia sp. SM1_7_0]|nr:hypothetical protein [Richelia sp. SM1_7_0]
MIASITKYTLEEAIAIASGNWLKLIVSKFPTINFNKLQFKAIVGHLIVLKAEKNLTKI